ncbi:MAG: patatin-like phospholipase family protein [Bacteroidales bacterium]|nr:patatin-like phospholipase family protein [Bacteroidales bacterium]
MAKVSTKKNIALVLSSGGARGLAHIGVIDEITERGYTITSIAGSSMGAFVGGLYASGNIDKFREWVINLDKLKIFNLIDFTLSSQGFIRGERVFEKMRKLKIIPEIDIENLPIRYIAVAADIINNKEVAFDKGNLYKAIRASISIPNVFTPIEYDGGILVDGGVLNPMPINKVLRSNNDLLIAVDLNSLVSYQKPSLPKKIEPEAIHSAKVTKLIKKWDELFSSHHYEKIEKPTDPKLKLGYFDILTRSIQLMQSKLTEQTIETYPPDVLVSISKYSCSVFEFYKGEEMIAYGREACKMAMDKAGL